MNVATMVTIDEAVKITGVSKDLLSRLIALGLLQKAQNLEGHILIPLDDVKRVERLLGDTQEDIAEMEGRPIHLSRASRLYGIPSSSLSRWYRSGYIRRVGKEKNRVLLNEADVFFVKLVMEMRNLKPGQSLGYVLKSI